MASSGALSYLTVQGPSPASYTPPKVDSSWIGNLPNDLWAGEQYGRERRLQNLFQAGSPGAAALQSGDTGRLFQLLAQSGGAPVVQQLLPQMLGAESSRAIMSGINGGGQLSALPTGGADPRGKIPVITAAAQKYGVDPAVALRVAQSEGLGSFYGDGGRSGTAFQLYTHGGLGNEFQKETGLNPLDPKNEDAAIDWAMRNVARTGWGPYKGAAKVGIGPRQGIGTVPRSSPGIDQETAQQGPTPGTSAAESAQAGPQGAPAVEQPSGAIGNAPFMGGQPTPANNVASGPANITLAQQQPAPAPTAAPGMDMARAQMLRDKQQKLQRASEAAAANPYSPKGFAERIQRDSDVAGEQAKQIEEFNAERAKQQYGVGIAEQTKAVGAVGEARGKRVAEVIEAGGKSARDTINDLNTIQDAVRAGGDNIKYGPGAEYWNKAKQVLNNIYPQQGLAEADTIVKMNARLAAAAAKSMTARPSQLEFKTFVANNPGIMNSKAGTIALLDILKQSAQQQINLGREAMRASPDQWQDIEDNFYQKNPLMSPFTGQPLGQQTAPQSPTGGAPVRISSPAERSMLAPGTRYVAPDGSLRTKR